MNFCKGYSQINNLFITAFTWQPHLDTSIELAILLQKASKDVHYCFIWVHNIEEGSSLPHFLKKICAIMRLVRILLKYKIRYSLYYVGPSIFFTIPKFKDLSYLESYRLKEKPIGLGILSTLSDLCVDKIINSDDSLRLAPILLKRAISVHDIAEKVIRSLQPDSLYQFNPRFSNTRSIYLAAQGLIENIYTYEIASTPNKYSLVNGSIFDGSLRSRLIKKHWSHAPLSKFDIARSFFSDLKHNSSMFCGSDEFDCEPYIDRSRINLLFCPSSIAETYALGDLYNHGLFVSQDHALKTLINLCSNSDSYNLIIRVHPIVALKSDEEKSYWSNITATPNIRIVQFYSRVSTYDLMRRVDRLIVYHSTIAIEASFEGIPSMALGSPWWIDLNCVFKPSCFLDVQKFIDLDTNLIQNLDYSKALLFAYYLKTYGTNYNYIR